MKPKILLTDHDLNMLRHVRAEISDLAYVTHETEALLDRATLAAAAFILRGGRPAHIKNPEVFDS